MEIDLKEGKLWRRKAGGLHSIVFSQYTGFIPYNKEAPLTVVYYPVEWNHREWKLCRGWEGGTTVSAIQFLKEFEPCATEPKSKEDLHRPGAKEHPSEGDVYTPRLMSEESCQVVVRETGGGLAKNMLLFQKLEQHGSTLVPSSTKTFSILKEDLLKEFKLAPGMRVAEPNPAEDLHRPGAKEGIDTKVDLLFLFEYFPRALEAVARLSEFGASKYSRGGWRGVPDGEIEYRKAMLRHTMKRYTEGDFDLGPSGSGLLHGVAEAWNALAALEFEIDRHGGFEAPEALIEQGERQ